MEVRGKPGYDLITENLENITQKVRLLNIKEDSDKTVVATVFVPNTKRDYFLKKINKYKETDSGTEVIGSIESINKAFVETLWIGDKRLLPKEKQVWCEIWLIYQSKENIEQVVSDFKALCNAENIEIKDQQIVFPERIVISVKANHKQLASLVLSS